MKKIPPLVLALALLAGTFGLVRYRQTHRTIEGAALRFTNSHAVDWDPAVRTITRIGDDPYVWFDLPETSIPVREFTVEFAGPTVTGRSGFYVYRYPAQLNGVELNDSYVTVGQQSVRPDGFTIHWKLGESKIVRLDFPDDLDRPVEIRRVHIASTFNGGWAATLMWLCALFAVAIPSLRGLAGVHRRAPWAETLAMVALIALKLAVASDLKLTFFGVASHDDALFVSLADSIMHGRWLGDFNELTLAKGPVYSLFLALVGLAGIPLLMAQALFHALACMALVVALRPLVPSMNARLVLFAVVLFDPQTLSSEAVGRVLRSGIQPALTLFVIAGAIGLATRIDRAARSVIPWAVLGGVAFLLFWYSREEGIWLVPSVALILGVAFLHALFQPKRARLVALAMLTLPVVVFLPGSWTLRLVNAHYYAAPVAIDVKDSAFPEAYGALVRIIPSQRNPTTPVARETRQRAYEVSPAFAELRPFLEGAVGDGWVALSQSESKGARYDGEIHGGWFQWALREAAAKAGRYHDAATAGAYWRKVAAELNAACDQRLLPAGPRRDSLFPRWDKSYWRPLRRALRGAAQVTVRFLDFSVQFPPMTSSAEQKVIFTRVTHEESAANFAPPTFRTHVRVMLAQVYRWAGKWAVIVGGLALLAVLGLTWRRRVSVQRAAILLGLFGGALALMLISALIEVTSFSALHAMYLAPATTLILAAGVLAPYWAREIFRENRPA